MVNNNGIPIEINKKPIETVYELKGDEYKVPSFEEFMKTYEVDESLNYGDLDGGGVGEIKGHGPCIDGRSFKDCYCSRKKLWEQRSINITNITIQNNIYYIWVNRWPGTIPTSPPSIENIIFETKGSTRPDNFRGIGSAFGIVGNIIGGLIEDRERYKPSGIVFTSDRRYPFSFNRCDYFNQTASLSRILGSNRGDFHSDKIVCNSKDHLIELKNKIGTIVEIFEFKTLITIRIDKQQEFEEKVQDILDKHDRGSDVNGHYIV